MRILFLGEPASPNTITWVNGFKELGCDVDLASVRVDATSDALPIGDPKLPPRMRVVTGMEDLKKKIRDRQPDILLAYRITSYGFLAARTGFQPLVLAAQNEHITYMDCPSFWRKIVLKRCAKYAIKRAKLIHAWGENVRRGLLTFGADDETIMVRHRGIDVKIFTPAAQPPPAPKGNPVFISTRSLTHEYLIDELIRAFALVSQTNPEARLVIVGDGRERQALEAYAADLGVADNVRFTGRLKSEEVAEELRKAHVYVSLIRTEGISSSLIEALAVGVIPVVADMPASRELVEDGRNGYLLPVANRARVAEIMRRAAYDGNIRRATLAGTDKIKNNYDRLRNSRLFLERYETLLN